MIKAVRDNKHLLTGIVLIKYKNKIQYWIGGIPPKEKYVGINELLHWNVIKRNLNTNVTYYDLVGANTKHLCRYKSKFNPVLKVYYTVEKGNLKGNLLKLFLLYILLHAFVYEQMYKIVFIFVNFALNTNLLKKYMILIKVV